MCVATQLLKLLVLLFTLRMSPLRLRDVAISFFSMESITCGTRVRLRQHRLWMVDQSIKGPYMPLPYVVLLITAL